MIPGEKQAKISYLVLYKEKMKKMEIDGVVTSICAKKERIIVFRGRTAYLTLLLKSAKIKKAFTKARRKKDSPIAGNDLNVLI